MEALSREMPRGLTDLRVEEVRPLPSAASAAAKGATAPAVPGAPLTLIRAITRLETIAGGDRREAERWVAETGSDMARVGTAARLAAWGGVAPGHDARAGKPRDPAAHGMAISRGAPSSHSWLRRPPSSRPLSVRPVSSRRGVSRAATRHGGGGALHGGQGVCHGGAAGAVS
jgi:Transposase IS116/IS110/IS902 family